MRTITIECDTCGKRMIEDEAFRALIRVTGKPGNQISKEVELDLCENCAMQVWAVIKRREQGPEPGPNGQETSEVVRVPRCAPPEFARAYGIASPGPEEATPHSPVVLYQMWVSHMESEGLPTFTWDDLDSREMIAWGKLYRQIVREWVRAEVEW